MNISNTLRQAFKLIKIPKVVKSLFRPITQKLRVIETYKSDLPLNNRTRKKSNDQENNSNNSNEVKYINTCHIPANMF